MRAIQVEFRLQICLLSLALAFSGCRSGRQAILDRPQLAPGVTMLDATFFSTALDRTMPYRVFLPDKLIPGQKLPVVYLLHGGGGNFRDWSNNSSVSRFAAAGLILVMPEGNSSYYMNSVEKPQDRYEDYLTKDLIADVEQRFPAKSARENRAIVGVSMGGFAAVKLAFSRPDLYVFAGALSPAIDVPERQFRWKRIDQWWGFRRIFGPMGSPERLARDPFLLAQSANPKVTPYLYLTAGEQEPLLEPIRRFSDRLKQRGFAHDFHAKSGGHDWGQWDSQIQGCFTGLFRIAGAIPGDGFASSRP